jgi:hypothetical protein
MVQCHSLLLQDLLGSVWHVEIISVPNILISSTLHNAGNTEIFKNYNLALRRNQLRVSMDIKLSLLTGRLGKPQP